MISCIPECVLHLALALSLGVLSPIQLAASVSSGAAVAVCFAPEEDCAAFAVRPIDKAESEILVSAYGLTIGSGIVEALVRAKERGVDVRLIADKTTPCSRASGIKPLATAGVPIWIDDQASVPWHSHTAEEQLIVVRGCCDGGDDRSSADPARARRVCDDGKPHCAPVRVPGHSRVRDVRQLLDRAYDIKWGKVV